MAKFTEEQLDKIWEKGLTDSIYAVTYIILKVGIGRSLKFF